GRQEGVLRLRSTVRGSSTGARADPSKTEGETRRRVAGAKATRRQFWSWKVQRHLDQSEGLGLRAVATPKVVTLVFHQPGTGLVQRARGHLIEAAHALLDVGGGAIHPDQAHATAIVGALGGHQQIGGQYLQRRRRPLCRRCPNCRFCGRPRAAGSRSTGTPGSRGTGTPGTAAASIVITTAGLHDPGRQQYSAGPEYRST